jgi:putative SOS response-associated peptidase YedK
VLVSNYVDWHWEDAAGKKKTRYNIYSQDEEIFALAGIHHSWKEPSGKQWNTFSIVTTAPNPSMKYIHNRKAEEGDERMPIMLRTGDEAAWLDPKNHPLDFAYPRYEASLMGIPV